MQKDDLKKQAGFTLVELIVALTLLLVVALAFVPMFVYVSEGSQNNRARLIALKLASSKIEEIRALPYDQVGTVGGDPVGVILREYQDEVDGIKFTILTEIRWVDDPADNDASGYDPLPYDYKSVEVAVSSPSVFTGEVVKTAKIDTLVSMEGEEEAYPGGNIRAIVQRGWKTGDDEVPVKGVQVGLVSGPSAPRTQFTDDLGKILFAILDEGDYTVKATPPSGMMLKPGTEEQNIVVVEATTETAIFEAEYPCSLEVHLIDNVTGDAIAKGGTLILQTPFIGDVVKTFTPEMNGVLPTDLFGKVWPVGVGSFGDAYGLKVLAEGYLPYNMRDDAAAVWDGKFTAPGENRIVTIGLTPANASIKVIDDSTAVPVTEANVQIYQHNVSSCSTVPLREAVTNEDGTISFALPNCIDDTSYCVCVTKEGYNDFEQHRAFQVINDQQVDGTGLIDTYIVRLVPEPNTVSLRVVVTDRQGYACRDEWIRLVGASKTYEDKTDTQGEVLFTDLELSQYTVYLGTEWWFLGWHISWAQIWSGQTVNGVNIVEHTK
jgi:prepilin-type N-terminal cleavage/methylation domain-containing protein